MAVVRAVILLFSCFAFCLCYDRINEHQQIMLYYEENSYIPIIHVYYNKHFSKSKQFQNFIETVQETEDQVGSYVKILLSDCEFQKSYENVACNEIKRLNENRMIIGYIPNSKFTNFGGKLMQSPPQNKLFDHYSDTYTVEELVRFANQLVPNFLKQIKNTNEFEQFKNPRYVPKLIFVSQQGEIPPVIKQISVQFFLKFDMAFVEDLTESVVNMLEIQKFPSLMVLKHNFQTDKLEIFNYDSQNFDEDQAKKIRKFLAEYALKEKRNDRVFHLIKMPKHSQIQTVDENSALEESLDRIKSWVFLEEGPSFSKLVELKTKYGLFYDYIHYYKSYSNQSKLYLINSKNNYKVDFDGQELRYRLMNAQDLHTNMTLWLKKDYVVMGVREQYGYLCTIIDKPLFAGLAQCFVIDEESYEQVTDNIKMKFKYGFIVAANNTRDSRSKVHGNEIKTLDFQQIYRTLDYTTRLKVKEIIDNYLEHPVMNITSSIELHKLCSQPFKKCIIYFYKRSNDNTRLEYLQLEAKDFVNQYKIYAVDLSCNEHFYDEIPQLKESHGGLIAYHPRLDKYVYLKAKMTRNVIRKFLQINNQDKKTLPFKSFSTETIFLNNCDEVKEEIQTTDSSFQQEL